MNPFGQLARERLLLLIRLEGYWGIGQERFPCYVGEELQKLQESISGVYLVSKFQNVYVGVSSNSGTPISHPKMIIFSRKTHGCWVPSSTSALTRQAEETHAAIRKFMAEAVSEEVAEKAAIVCLSFPGVFKRPSFFLKGTNGRIGTIVPTWGPGKVVEYPQKQSS